MPITITTVRRAGWFIWLVAVRNPLVLWWCYRMRALAKEHPAELCHSGWAFTKSTTPHGLTVMLLPRTVIRWRWFHGVPIPFPLVVDSNVGVVMTEYLPGEFQAGDVVCHNGYPNCDYAALVYCITEQSAAQLIMDTEFVGLIGPNGIRRAMELTGTKVPVPGPADILP